MGLLLIAYSLASCAMGGASVVVEWTTETEVDTAGFNLYRSESPDGPYVKVNDTLIPASPDPLTGGHYVYTDTQVIAGRTYYYQLEDVEISGQATRHGPIVVRAAGGWATWLWTGGIIAAGAALIVALRWRGARREPQGQP
ncbi:MAG: hypothetical protein Kow0047_19810 [Anaerolineae bacterium]